MTMDQTRASSPSTILHVFPGFGIGGAQRRTVDLVNTILADRRHVIVALDRDFSAAEQFGGNVRHRLVSLGYKHSRRPDLGNLRTFRKLVVQHRPDLLITYNWGSIEAALANRLAPLCPHLHFEDGFGPDETSSQQLPRRVWGRRLALSGKSKIVVPSKTLLSIAEDTWRFRSNKVCYIPNGIDCNRFAVQVQDQPPVLRNRDDEILIGTVASLRAVKNVARLLRLFAAVRGDHPTRLIIVGDGPERSKLCSLANELGIADQTLFTGEQPLPEQFLEQLDIFALTSDTEQMPYCLIEAMAAGLPVTATDVGDVKLMLPEASQAFVAAPSNTTALIACLKRLIERPALRQTLGVMNRKHAHQHFDREVMLSRYIDLFSSLLPS